MGPMGFMVPMKDVQNVQNGYKTEMRCAERDSKTSEYGDGKHGAYGAHGSMKEVCPNCPKWL